MPGISGQRRHREKRNNHSLDNPGRWLESLCPGHIYKLGATDITGSTEHYGKYQPTEQNAQDSGAEQCPAVKNSFHRTPSD